jgi:fatty acid-binding protein DegV
VILREGALDLTERVRTRQKSINRIIEIIRQRVGNRKVNVAVVHARSPQSAQDLLDQVRQILNCHELITTDLSIGVAANLGPGTVGIAAYPVEEG